MRINVLFLFMFCLSNSSSLLAADQASAEKKSTLLSPVVDLFTEWSASAEKAISIACIYLDEEIKKNEELQKEVKKLQSANIALQQSSKDANHTSMHFLNSYLEMYNAALPLFIEQVKEKQKFEDADCRVWIDLLPLEDPKKEIFDLISNGKLILQNGKLELANSRRKQ